MLILDDFFLCYTVSDQQMEVYLQLAQKYGCGSLRLIPSPIPRERLPEGKIGVYVKGKAYRVSAQVAIWNTKYLIKLLEQVGNCELWEFERRGSFISEQFPEPMLGTFRYTFPYVEIICGGQWLSSGPVFCSQAGVHISREVRETESDFVLGWRCIRGGIF